MKARLYGRSSRSHAIFAGVFALLFLGFVTLAILGATQFSYEPHQWILMGFLTLSAGLTAAWELRALLLMGRGSADPAPAPSAQSTP